MFARLLLDDMRLKSKCNRMCELHRLLYAHRDSSTVALYHELELHHFPFMIAALQCIACMYCLRVYRMPHRRSQIPIIAVAATAATAAAAIQNETFDGNMCEFEEERERKQMICVEQCVIQFYGLLTRCAKNRQVHFSRSIVSGVIVRLRFHENDKILEKLAQRNMCECQCIAYCSRRIYRWHDGTSLAERRRINDTGAPAPPSRRECIIIITCAMSLNAVSKNILLVVSLAIDSACASAMKKKSASG